MPEENHKPHLLFVDDDEAATRTLIQSIVRRGADFNFHEATSARQALVITAEFKPEVAVLDLSLDPTLGPESGLNLISELLNIDPTLRVLVLTGHGAEEFGLKALHSGAASFLNKPVDASHLLALIRDAISFATLKRQYNRLSASPDHLRNASGLTSANPRMQKVIEAVSYAATNLQPVLISGETGTGKGVIAHAIHQASPRHEGPFIRVQPRFGNPDLISSEIFGHQKGAFTGATENRRGLIEEADRGTLFIDEVDELPNETQVLLLNVLQERVFRRLGSSKESYSNFRLIAATNCPVAQIIKTKKLRDDFYHRIAHFSIEVPPLRERPEDIPALAENFVRAIGNRENIPVQGLDHSALARLVSYSWPGNVRELQAVVEGGVYRAQFCDRRFIEADDLMLTKKGDTSLNGSQSFRERVRFYERELIKEALTLHNGNQSQAAASLGLDRTSLRRILEREKVEEG